MNNKYLTETERDLIYNKPPYDLTLTIEELTNPAKKNTNNYDKIPRPQNRWIIFRKNYEANIRLCSPVKQRVKHTAKECSSKWKKLSSEVKHFFKILEKLAYENHKLIYPNYKYKPKSKNSSRKEFIFREQKRYVSIPPAKSSVIAFNKPQEPVQIDKLPYLTPNSLQEPTQIDGPPYLTSNSPELMQIDGPPPLTLAISTAIYNNQDHTNNFTTFNYNQDYSNDCTTTIYSQQDYTDNSTTAISIYNQQDYTNDLAQNVIDNVFNNDKLNYNDNQSPIFFAESTNNGDNNNDSLNISSITPLISSPLSQSQSSSQLFMTKYNSCHF
ncbi:7361_t:CDS:1 [Ambispora gerdemannii]|uniref:7361_t:CDS:1 n=1 Tax=Ambispora gerdemannii TaxID=144530 RepID=A0A9N9B426_9GLOM|nr:7361_t:CDS:1 [Ambispora gerdemannii]